MKLPIGPPHWSVLLLPTIYGAITPQKPLTPSEPQSLNSPAPLPLVIWHGLGDNYEADGMRSIGELAEATNPGTHVYYIRLDADPSADRTATFFGNLTVQISQVCADIASHPVLSEAPAINALGFSQGGQFMRGFVERCNVPRVANLVTFGAQHNGISEYQKCDDGDWVCQSERNLLRGNTWSQFVQNRLVPAQYFRDPEELDAYIEGSNFLADINNEREMKNQMYKDNMKKLDKFATYIFSEDKTVIPKESAWFSEVNTTSGEITVVQKRKMYEEDWIGLRWLDEKGRLDFRMIDGGHMQFGDEVLVDMFKTYFSPPE